MATYTLIAGLVLCVLWILKTFWGWWNSTVRLLPGPPNPSIFYGSLKEAQLFDPGILYERYSETYGCTFRYRGVLSRQRVYTKDLKAIRHILSNDYIWEKPEPTRFTLGRLVGRGLLVVEGDEHRQQRRILNPAFGSAQIRELTEVFVQKSLKLRDVWQAEIAASQLQGEVRIDAVPWLSKATLDMIGLAGFNYTFNALDSSLAEENELLHSFNTLFKAAVRFRPFNVLQTYVPIMRAIPTNSGKNVLTSLTRMKTIGNAILRDSKSAAVADAASNGASRGDWSGRNILSLLVRANLASDLKDSQRLSDEDVLAQIPTFLLAGHETTSTGTTWALFALTQHLAVQDKLRRELLSLDTDTPTMEQLNSLEYLEFVVREVLRLHPPVPSTVRVSVRDDVIPLSVPIVDKKGNELYELRVKKGQTVFLPIVGVNRDPGIWGDDAHEFKPERWKSIPEAVHAVPGVWSGMLSFLGGARSCIGYRFAVVEMKALLFTLVRAFEFELAVPGSEIGKRSVIVQRPILRSKPEAGNQLPLTIRPFVAG